MHAAQQRGFTIVELLVSIAIMAVIISLTIPAYNNYRSSQLVVQEGKKLVTNLRLAQSQASGGVKNGCTGTFLGWSIQTQPNSYTLTARCDVNEVEYRTFTLPQGMSLTITGISGDHQLLFQPINKDVTSIKNNSTQLKPIGDSIITIIKDGTSTSVTIRRTGDIY